MTELNRDLIKGHRRKLVATIIGVVIGSIVLGLMAIGFALTQGRVIEVMPDEVANSYLVERETGIGFVFDRSVYSLLGDVAFKISAKGFETQSRTINQNSPRVIHVELKPAKAHIHVTTDTQNEGMVWLLDGRPVGKGASIEIETEAGTYSISADNPYFQPQTKIVSVGRGETVNQQFSLMPINGSLAIKSVPSGKAVKIDGILIGETPIRINKEGGAYGLLIESQEFIPVTERLNITHRQPDIERTYKLQLAPGYLTATGQPGGGTFLANGQAISEAVKTALPARKKMKVSYQHPGYYTETKSIVLEPHQEMQVSFTLKQELGKVSVRSSPSGALYINGARVGNTPREMSLPAVVHNLEIKRGGYRSFKASFTPSGNRKHQIDAKLLTEFEARRAEGRPTFASQIGVKLKQFRPNDFMMGSPPGEKGKRRNEGYAKVQMRRPFLVSVHEITVEQFAKFRKGGGAGDTPVVNVSWNDAVLFCNWMSVQEGLPPFYNFENGRLVGVSRNSMGYRLPTEAEWEWLAKRAGREIETVFVWGDRTTIPDRAGNFADRSAKGKARFIIPNYQDGFAELAPVGSFAADRLGLHDLAGNASEWVHDWFTFQPQSTLEQDPMGAATGDGHVVKGASWKSGRLEELRTAYRQQGVAPETTIGFRVARYAK